jgi:hypothetical protein
MNAAKDKRAAVTAAERGQLPRERERERERKREREREREAGGARSWARL